MNQHEQLPPRANAFARVNVGTALVLAVLGLAACHGGGQGDGSSGGGGGPVASALAVHSVLPASGSPLGGTVLRVSGEHFAVGEAHLVFVGGKAATDVVVIDEHTLSCRTPSGTAGATVDLEVRNRLGEGRLADAFSYLAVLAVQSDVNGDGIADLVVASPSDDAAGADSGAVYVYFGSSNPLDLQHQSTAQADLKITGHHAGDAFGADLCIGDVTGDHVPDLVVGANHVSLATANDAGAAYVFRGPLAATTSMSALAANARLVGESLVAGDRFGSALEIGDVDGDGVGDLMVGAAGHDAPGKSDAGCVYLFRGGATMVSKGAEQADFGFDGTSANERVGERITCGDLNGDGLVDLVVSSQFADPANPYYLSNAGQVYVVWGGALQSQGLTAASAVFSGSAVEDRFGASATVADVNGDGTDDLIVGAPLSDGVDYDVGKVYVFLGGPTLASRTADQADIVFAGQPTHNSLGRCVRTGDVNGDGIADVLVGAPEADYLNDDNGRAYLFLGGAGLANRYAVQADALFNGEIVQGENFGASLSLLDFNDDGLAEVVCGSAKHGAGAGRVYLWLGTAAGLPGTHLASQADVHVTGSEVGAEFASQFADGQ